MNYNLERNDQYVLIQLNEKHLNYRISADLEKLIVQLYKEGFTNMILELGETQSVDIDGQSVIRKATKVCRTEGGLFVIVSTNDDLLDEIDAAKIPELAALTNLEEAIDIILLNDTSDDFPEEDDDEYFSEFGGSSTEE